jgi:hypothetical protein
MLTDHHRQMLLAMQCITVPEKETIPECEVLQVWEWAEFVLKAHQGLNENPQSAISIGQKAVENDYQRLADVFQCKAAIHVVNGEVRICSLEELPPDRVKLFEAALS